MDRNAHMDDLYLSIMEGMKLYADNKDHVEVMMSDGATKQTLKFGNDPMIDQANEARKDRNERLRSIATIAGAAGGILIAGLNLALGLRATKKEEDYEHVNREGMNAATRGLSGLNGLFRK